MERNNRFAHSLSYWDPHIGVCGYFWVFSNFRCKNWCHILAWQTRFPIKATKSRAYLAYF